MRASSLICLSLLTWCAGCATPAPRPAPPPVIDPPPANLAQPCTAGPDYPGDAMGDIPLGQLLDIAEQREAAAAVCREQVRALLKAWPR